MRLVRRRGLNWREAALKAVPTASKDKWSQLLRQLKETQTCKHPGCGGPEDPAGCPIHSKQSMCRTQEPRLTAAQEEEIFSQYTWRLQMILGILLAGFTCLALYTLLSLPSIRRAFFGEEIPMDDGDFWPDDDDY